MIFEHSIVLKPQQIEEVLEEAKKKKVDVVKSKAEKNFDKYRHIFEDYLRGMLVSEIASKLGTTRYQVYSILNRYGIPRRPISDLSLVHARRIIESNPSKRKEWFEKNLCPCLVCQWLRFDRKDPRSIE